MQIRKAKIEDANSIMTLTNTAYLVENGDSIKIECAKSFDTIEDVKKVIEILNVSELQGKVVGVIGIKGDESKAVIGPLAVHPTYQGRGISRRLLIVAEDQSEVTVAEIINCKEYLIKMYERIGYRKKREVDLCSVIPKKFLTRPGLSVIEYEKSNVIITMTKPSDNEMGAVMKVVNDAYKVELGNSGVSFKSADRFVTMEDAPKIQDKLTLGNPCHIWQVEKVPFNLPRLNGRFMDTFRT